MNKHTNPFDTITEAMEVLKALGVDPKASTSNRGATYPFPWGGAKQEVDWREHILNITVNKDQSLTSAGHHRCHIHLTSEGFEAVLKLLKDDYPIKQEICFAEYDMFTIEPSPLLELYKLELREEPEVPTCDCGTQN